MRRRAAAVSLAGLLVLCACSGQPRRPATSRATLSPTECPSDVESLLVVPHGCEYLTVAAEQAKPTAGTFRLLVVRLDPPNPPPRPDPVLIVGDEIGGPLDYGGHQPTAQRVNRVVYLLEARGTGHAGLTCPEVDRMSEDLSTPAGDAGRLQMLLAAVRACRDQLVSAGTDPSQLGLEQMAHDVEDLRVALGINSWNLASYGSASRVLLEAVRESSQHVRAIWLDSPQFPQLDEPTEAAVGTTMALNQAFDTCQADAACNRSYPDLRNLWAAAVSRLDAHPVSAHAADGRTVLVDVGAFVRAIRALLSASVTSVPAAIADAADGGSMPTVVSTLAKAGWLCTGYRLGCIGPSSFATYLSVLCRDEAPFVDAQALQRATSALPGIEQAFRTNPYLAACPAWNVPAATVAVHAPVTAKIPTLVAPGQFDPFAPPELARQLGATLPKSYLLEVPAASHNTLGESDCPITIRNVWLDSPSTPPAGTGCLARLAPHFVAP